MMTNKKKPTIPFVVAFNKIDEFLNAKTVKASEAIVKSKTRRKALAVKNK